MRLVEYPQYYTPDGVPSLYLAGSGAGRPGWQADAVALLAAAGFTGTVLNPQPCSRPGSGTGTPAGWQEHNLRRIGVVLLWCPHGAQQVLDVRQRFLHRSRTELVVGCDGEDRLQRFVRAELFGSMPRLAVATDLAAAVRATLDHLSAPATARR
ncbi:hypothetical protein [Streptomyces sp. MJM8645]|uniref:hypothetical protein n=1 Tax=Streptomycetaceae TaxID=2062 RepID=UPI0007AF5619|nr:hypothetical protein [Streptomyces sp. MJM8645]